MLEQLITKKLKDNLSERISQTQQYGLDNLVENYLDRSLPSLASKYYNPEKEYLIGLSKDLNPYFNDLLEELKIKINSRDPEQLMNCNVRELITFNDNKKHQEFCNKIKGGIEELTYAAEIGLIETYRILEVKMNTPIIGYFAKRKLKSLGFDYPPNHGELVSKLNSEKEEVLGLLNIYAGYKVPNILEREEIKRKYHERMQKISSERRLLAHDYEAGYLDLNKEIEREHLDRSQKLRRDLDYSWNDYNSFFESIIGTIGSFINYIFGR